MNGKTVLIFAVSVAFFTLAATYRFHDSAHSMGMIKKGGGMARHPARLDSNRDSYVLIATAGVLPPYRGNARVVLEGDPSLTATFHNSEVPVDLGVHRHPTFRDNTYYDLRPKDRIALWVKIKRTRAPGRQQDTAAEARQQDRGVEPLCSQCEPDAKTSTGVSDVTGGRSSAAAGPENGLSGPHMDRTGNKGGRDGITTGKGWSRKGEDPAKARGPAVAFYDVATSEPLLRIPIRFTDGKEGVRDEH